MKDNKIDYTKLNNRIVEQAYADRFTLSETDMQRLIEGKFKRAKEYYESLAKAPVAY